MWTDGLEHWYAGAGRHDLSWRQTTDPWAVLVSEVMLQQTSVARVLPRWTAFLRRWPAATLCAASTLDDVLREWQGLGYPRRARALWLTAQRVQHGWPDEEVGLRSLPGVGTYTARALLAFSDLGGHGKATAPPRDVNLARVAARAALGCEAHEVRPSVLDAVLRDARPAAMSMRHYAYALFDVGSLHCRARSRCEGCPAAGACLARNAGAVPTEAPRRQAPYRGSVRQLRGALLAAALSGRAASREELRAAVAGLAEAGPDRVGPAIDGLVRDGLITLPGPTTEPLGRSM